MAFFAPIVRLGIAVASIAWGVSIGAPVSFHKEVEPVLSRSCKGCHKVGKAKGGLDLSTHAALMKGGKHGVSIVPGNPKSSRLVEEISGTEPSMPKDGTPLTKFEVSILEKWIKEGANDDSPTVSTPGFSQSNPPTNHSPAAITAMAFSPDGDVLAIAGQHEVLLQPSDGSDIRRRFIGASPRIESITFSKNGNLLAAAGGAPGRFGELQIWHMGSGNLLHSFKAGSDCMLGASFSPDNHAVAAGGVDDTARVWTLPSGMERFQLTEHSDWCTGTGFTMDGGRLVTVSRDKTARLVTADKGIQLEDPRKLEEPILVMALRPGTNQMATGGEAGGLRLHKIGEESTAGKSRGNVLREFERQPWPVSAAAFSSDGQWLAAGGAGDEVHVYNTEDGKKAATLKGHRGAVFALAWFPGRESLATAGSDGIVRIYDVRDGMLQTSFKPHLPVGRPVGR